MIDAKKKIAVIAVVLVVVFSLVVFSSNKFFLFSSDLQVQKLNPVNNRYQNQYISEIYDSDIHLGEVAFTFNEAPNASLHRLWIDTSHYNNSVLDKVVFKFSSPSNSLISVYTKATNPIVDIDSFSDQGVTTVTVNPGVALQKGTLHFGFVVETFGTIDKMQVSTELSVHQQAFLQLTQMNAALTIEHNFL